MDILKFFILLNSSIRPEKFEQQDIFIKLNILDDISPSLFKVVTRLCLPTCYSVYILNIILLKA